MGLQRITPKCICIFQCMLERTDAIPNKVLEPITFLLAYPTIFKFEVMERYLYADGHKDDRNKLLQDNNT